MFADTVAPRAEFEEEEARLLAPAIQEAETAEQRLEKAQARAAKAVSDERMKQEPPAGSLPRARVHEWRRRRTKAYMPTKHRS